MEGDFCLKLVWAMWPTLILTKMQKYVITFIHRASLPNPQELPDLWALAARALALGQLGVGLVVRLWVCGRQG